jgi:hypothetical protein
MTPISMLYSMESWAPPEFFHGRRFAARKPAYRLEVKLFMANFSYRCSIYMTKESFF